MDANKKGLSVRRHSIKILKMAILCTLFITMIFILSCDKQKEEKIGIDRHISDEWNSVFMDASKIFQIGEIKKIVFENPYDVNRCIVIRGGSIIAGPDVLYKEYVKNGIPASVSEKLVREYMGEGLRMFFLKDDMIIDSIELINVRSRSNIYYTEVGKQITFSIQLLSPLTEQVVKDPNFLELPEFGRDYLTNPKRPKPIEIVKIE